MTWVFPSHASCVSQMVLIFSVEHMTSIIRPCSVQMTSFQLALQREAAKKEKEKEEADRKKHQTREVKHCKPEDTQECVVTGSHSQ